MAVLINGDGYSPVTAQQDADFFAGIFGQDLCVLDVGSNMAASIQSATCVRIADGEAIVQGRRIHNDVGTYDDFDIPVGAQGTTKHYIIGYELYRDVDTKEKCRTFVQEVASATATISQSVIRDGATSAKISMYRVLKEGVNIESVTPMFVTRTALANSWPIGSIYQTVNNINPGTIFGGTWEEITGKFLLGRSSGHAAGTNGGSETVTLEANQLPSHHHTLPAHTHTGTTEESGNHRHQTYRRKTGATGTARYTAEGEDTNGGWTAYGGKHTHTFTTNQGGSGQTGDSGSGNPVTIMPPFLSVYMWVRIA